MDGRGNGISFLAGARDFLYSIASTPAVGLAQPPIRWVLGALSPGGKAAGREADHSPPSSAGVKTDGVIPPFTGITLPLPSEGEW
jgi:hypothetical protein